MRLRFFKAVLIGACVLVVTSCTMARHSNTMLFGTNTKFGIEAGLDATQIPRITVGYARQEAVVMPLVANKSANDGSLIPCEVPNDAKHLSQCKLVARRSDGGTATVEDSYSVLASFGAEFDTEAGGTGVKVDGGLAQYFATGVAAQLLAARGGAALVAVGDAAKAASSDLAGAAAAAAVVSPAAALGIRDYESNKTGRDAVIACLTASTDWSATLKELVAEARLSDSEQQYLSDGAGIETIADVTDILTNNPQLVNPIANVVANKSAELCK